MEAFPVFVFILAVPPLVGSLSIQPNPSVAPAPRQCSTYLTAKQLLQLTPGGLDRNAFPERQLTAHGSAHRCPQRGASAQGAVGEGDPG